MPSKILHAYLKENQFGKNLKIISMKEKYSNNKILLYSIGDLLKF